jgi:hypothetical protein
MSETVTDVNTLPVHNLVPNESGVSELEFIKIYRQTYLGELTDSEKQEEITITVTCHDAPKTTKTKKKPSLLKGIEIKNYYSNFIEDPFNESIKKAGLDENNGPKLYKKLKKISEILTKKVPENVKYLEIGKMTNESCSKQKPIFEKFIVEYCKILANNKYFLLCKLRDCMIANMKLIANCDFNNLESISNKWLDDSFKRRSIRGIKEYLNEIKEVVNKIVGDAQFDTLIEKINEGNIQVVFNQNNEAENLVGGESILQKAYKSLSRGTTPESTTPSETVPGKISAVGQNVANFTASLVGKRQSRIRSKSMKIPELDIGVVEREQIYTEINNIIRTERTNIIGMHELFKNQFCSFTEMGKTAEISQKDVWWQATPSLVAYTVASTTFSANSAIFIAENEFDIKPGVPTMADYLQKESGHIVSNATGAIALATFINAAVGPIVGVAVGALIGTIINSKWFKNLRSSRLENVTFQRFINDNDEYINIMNKNELKVNDHVCSYRHHLKEYIFRCLYAMKIRDSYNKLAKKMFDDPLDKLKYYLFVYDDCVVTNKFSESTEETKEETKERKDIHNANMRKEVITTIEPPKNKKRVGNQIDPLTYNGGKKRKTQNKSKKQSIKNKTKKRGLKYL